MLHVVIVLTDGDRYYTVSKLNNHITKDKRMALKFSSIERANEFRDTLLSKPKNISMYGQFVVVNTSEYIKRKNESTVTKISPEKVFSMKDEVRSMIQRIDEMAEYREYLNYAMSEIDKEIVDIEHYIEFNNLNAAEGYKAYKMLHDANVKRRNIKNCIEIVKHLNISEIKEEINRQDRRIYRPRVKTELFR